MKASEYVDTWKGPIGEIDKFIKQWVSDYRASLTPRTSKIADVCEYSLMSGGKRFRPLLSYFSTVALNENPADTLAFGAAVEFIHTYSLIHDDLPSMDDDDLRRGQPTSHKKFGEALAILAGDNLLTESFSLIEMCDATSKSKMKAVRLLTTSAGGRGMVGGQVMDIEVPDNGDRNIQTIMELHSLKTGALIKASVLGPAILKEASSENLKNLSVYSENLGVAFQVADDIEDAREGETGNYNYVHFLGEEGAFEKLEMLSAQAIDSVRSLPNPRGLVELVEFNSARLNG